MAQRQENVNLETSGPPLGGMKWKTVKKEIG